MAPRGYVTTDASFLAEPVNSGPVPRGRWTWLRPARERTHPVLILGDGGPHGYVSPSWYPGKTEHGRVVPTWNYAVVHVTGRLVVLDDADAVLDIVQRLTDTHEATSAVPWKVSDAPAEFVRAQLKGIVGLRLEIVSVEGKMKLSQNRPAADREGVVAGLEGRADAGSAAVAAMMRDGGS